MRLKCVSCHRDYEKPARDVISELTTHGFTRCPSCYSYQVISITGRISDLDKR